MKKLEGVGIGFGCVVALAIIGTLLGVLGVAFMGIFELMGWWSILLCIVMRQFTPQILFGAFVAGFSAFYTYEYLEWGLVLTIIIGIAGVPVGMAASQEGQELWKKERGLN